MCVGGGGDKSGADPGCMGFTHPFSCQVYKVDPHLTLTPYLAGHIIIKLEGVPVKVTNYFNFPIKRPLSRIHRNLIL